MSASKEQGSFLRPVGFVPARWVQERRLFYALGCVALVYACLAGLRTITDYDVFWQLATGRWIAQHHHIPSVDVFSYTAQGVAWIYPVGSALLFYVISLLGGYSLLSWLGAAACVGTTALLLRRGNLATAALAILAVPSIAARTTPRAEMFTMVIFAAFLSLLWQQHETGRARLWLLPLLMIAWVNLHLGFVSGLALLGGYALVEALQLLWSSERGAALDRLGRFWPWSLATVVATLANPWGWGIYRALFRQESAMAAHSQAISEWASVPLNWTAAAAALSLRNPDGAFFVLLLLVICAVAAAVWRRQLGAAVLLIGAAFFGIQHVRLQGLFAVMVVIVAGTAFASLLPALEVRIADMRIRSMLAVAGACLVALLACVRSVDLVTNRAYLERTTVASFGTGLSWWFPEKAAAFIVRENIQGQVFNDYDEGGFITWRLGPKYRDYIDGRAIPFGAGLLKRTNELMQSPPDSLLWQEESERYDINTIIVPLGRYDAVQFFPVLSQFCSSETWRPVYLDEVSAVFVRRRPETEILIQRSQIDCTTAPLPAILPTTNDAKAFNQWANAAGVLRVLGRDSEALDATTKALAIFPDSAFVHFTRGILFEQAGNLPDAEQQYLVSAALQPAAVAPWATLAACYQQAGQSSLAIEAWERAANLSPRPWGFLLEIGYADLELHRPREALNAFNRAASSLPSQPLTAVDNSFLGSLARGRAISWSTLGGVTRALAFQEEAVRWMPESGRDWLELADLYERLGRTDDARRARERAAALNQE
jgi:Tfp pilus assembly protein PilF